MFALSCDCAGLFKPADVLTPGALGAASQKLMDPGPPKKMDLPILQGPKESRNCVYGSPKGPKIGGLTWINQWESQK